MTSISVELENVIKNEDFYGTNDILEQIKSTGKGEEYIESLMGFMGDNPMLDYGMPGPIIHFIESFGTEQYIDILLKLEQTKPNIYFNWMLNRIINVSDGEIKDKYIWILQSIMTNDNVEEYIRDSARDFVEFQLS